MFGDALRLIRTFHQVSQIDLASQLGISRSYLSEIESGRKTPSIDLLQKYSTLFKIPLSSIMFFSENVNEPDRLAKARSVIGKKAVDILNWVESKAKLDKVA